MNAPKGKEIQRVTSEQWCQIRAEWESGSSTFSELSQKHDIAISSIKNRSSREKWRRGALKQETEKRIRESTIEICTRLGMPPEELIRRICDGARGVQTLKNVKRAYKDDSGRTVMIDQRPIIVEQTLAVDDNDITFKYRCKLADIMGLDAPPKSPVKSIEEKPELEYDKTRIRKLISNPGILDKAIREAEGLSACLQ